MNHDALRRAAILVTTLDTESADALLNEMSPDQAASIRHAIMELGDIDIVEQQEVMQQFVGRSGPTPPAPEPDVELEASLIHRLQHPSTPDIGIGTTPTPPADETESPSNAPFAFLELVNSSELARILANEHPQTLAIVAAHLSADQAAQVISHLPRNQQSDALVRIARLTPPHSDVIRLLEREIQALLTDHRVLDQVDPAGLAKVEAILRKTGAETRLHLVAELSQLDQGLARRLHGATHSLGQAAPTDRPGGLHTAGESLPQRCVPTAPINRPALSFADLEQLEDSAIAQVLSHCSPNITLLALAGTSHSFVKRIAAQLPSAEAAQLQRKIQDMGPLRLDDVQRAQQKLARTAQSLWDAGELHVPHAQRLSVAA